MSDDEKKEEKTMIPKCKKAMKLQPRAKPGRGRAEPNDVILSITDEEGWNNFVEQREAMGDFKEELQEFFNDEERTGIANGTIGDALFGEDTKDQFEGICDGLETHTLVHPH